MNGNPLSPVKPLKPGDKIGSLTILRKRSALKGHYAAVWICQCKCGVICEKNQISLRDKKLFHRCDECFSKSQIAHQKLLRLDAMLSGKTEVKL